MLYSIIRTWGSVTLLVVVVGPLRRLYGATHLPPRRASSRKLGVVSAIARAIL